MGGHAFATPPFALAGPAGAVSPFADDAGGHAGFPVAGALLVAPEPAETLPRGEGPVEAPALAPAPLVPAETLPLGETAPLVGIMTGTPRGTGLLHSRGLVC